MRHFTRLGHYSNDELLRLGDNSGDDLTRELCNRLEANIEPDHSGCYGDDDVENARDEARAELMGEVEAGADELKNNVKGLLSGVDDALIGGVCEKIDAFVRYLG